MTFGERLKDLRGKAGLSQSALAATAGIGLPTLKDYEGNRRGPSLEIAQRLASALGVNCQAFDGCNFQHATQAKTGTLQADAAAEPPHAKSRAKKTAAAKATLPADKKAAKKRK